MAATSVEEVLELYRRYGAEGYDHHMIEVFSNPAQVQGWTDTTEDFRARLGLPPLA